MEYIKWKGLPWEYAQKAYDEQHYIEAIQIMHGFLENQLQEILMLVGATKFDTKIEESWNVVNQISFSNCLKILFVIGQLNKKEYNDLIKLNSTRNKLVHQMFFEPYDKISPGFPKKKFDLVFKESIEAVKLVTVKLNNLID